MVYKYLFSTLIIVFLICLSVLYVAKLETEDVHYKLVSKAGNIEIREYEPMIIAHIKQTGDFNLASGNGFKELTHYIFGANANSTKIKMVMPILNISNDIDKILSDDNQMDLKQEIEWKVMFIIPSQLKMCTIPAPTNANINFSNLAVKKYIVIKFNGLSTSKAIKNHLELLKAYVKENNVSLLSELPIIANYNVPWTLPFLRKNEIMLEVKG